MSSSGYNPNGLVDPFRNLSPDLTPNAGQLANSPFANQMVMPYQAAPWWQTVWGSGPGGIVQGAVVDPLMGFPQTVAHVVAPGSSWANFTDATVDAINQAYSAAQNSAGRDPNAYDYWRKAGGLVSPGPLEVAPATNILGRFITNGAEGAANSLLTSPQASDMLDGASYGSGKADDAEKDAGMDAGKGLAQDAAGALWRLW